MRNKTIRVRGRTIRIVSSDDVQARLQRAYFKDENTLVVYRGLSRAQQEQLIRDALTDLGLYNERVENKYFPPRTRFHRRRGPKGAERFGRQNH